MGKLAKRLVFLLLILTLIGSSFDQSAWAQEARRSLVKEVWAWVEKGELRIQASLQKSVDEIEVKVKQDDEELTYSFLEGTRFSVAIKPSDSRPLTIEWRTAEEDEPVIRWIIPVPESVRISTDGIELREVSWDRGADKKEDQLELTSSEVTEQDEELEVPALSQQQAKVERWAKDFYREYSNDKKPRESALRSRPATFELEPNDTVGKADWLFDAKDAFGKIGKSGDVDMWKIKATRSGTMNISLRDIPRDQDYNLYVFSGDNQELGSSEQAGQADEAIDGITLEQGEWYYIKVQGSGGSYHKDFYYRLRTDFVSEQGEAKLDEYEPNNSLAEAHALTTDYDTTLQANLHSLTDIDFYQFGITLASTVRLDLKELPEGMDVDLYLLDQAGKGLFKSEKPKNANEQIVFQANPGTYIVKVAASQRSGFAPNTYKLDVAINTIPVIVIPGIGGSRLEVEESGKISEIWLGLGDSLIGINDPRHRRLLSLEPIRPNSVDVQPREDGIIIFPERADEGFRAIEYLSYSPLDPIRDTTEQYYSMVKQLEKMGYKKFRSLFAMPYDWRYSSTKNAVALKQKIDLALQRSGASQVQLVAHSMGGLLVRETLLTNVSYQSKVNRIIYMGTPFLGAPRAYQAIQYGYNFSIPWLDEETGKIISEYAPAVYELLPSKKYFQTVGFLKKDKNEPYSYDEFLQDKAIRLSYSPLVKQAGKLHEKWDAKTINVPQYSIVGQGEPTLLGYFFDHYHQAWTPYYDKGMGDGTVPYLSASYAQKDIKKKYYVTGEHAKLPSIPQVIHQVTQLLQGIEDTQPGLRKSASKQQKYLTYILSRDDGSFPEVSVIKSGKSMTLNQKKKEVWDDLSIEYHGNLVVLHVKDGEDLEFEQTNRTKAAGDHLQIQRFSSEDPEQEQETGKWYRLGKRGLMEASDLRQ
ncbi:esterase [Brevibacillus choshinensis]|uniref:lipase/acyltransferase domain-containing protein n=1 Tax=Brevibacillus choshinensis TaxID=54911 RepID=UPI002E1D7C4A|nr:esterase [Brevibacillus choshinensis]